MNGFVRVCLVIIIMLLAVIAIRPIVSVHPVLAAGHYQYMYVDVDSNQSFSEKEITDMLNKRSAEGWDLFGASTYQSSGIRTALIFRKRQ
ncbi:MAG: hypothetical protein WBR26_25765 [Candidatus Acidiferrum sp.]